MRAGNWFFIATIIAGVLLGLADPARAAGIANPSGLAAGSAFYVIDQTAATTEATSNSLATYNSIVQTDASGRGIGSYNGSAITWDALVSVSGGADAISLFDPNAPIYNVNGQEIAANGAALWDSNVSPLLNAIASPGTTVFTGTNYDGTDADTHPLGDSSNLTTIGNSGNTATIWATSDAAAPSSNSLPIYGFSSALIAAPEPTALSLLGLGVTALLARRRKAN